MNENANLHLSAGYFKISLLSLGADKL